MTEEIQQLGVEAEIKLQSNETHTVPSASSMQKNSGNTASTTMALASSSTADSATFVMTPTAIVQMRRALEKYLHSHKAKWSNTANDKKSAKESVASSRATAATENAPEHC